MLGEQTTKIVIDATQDSGDGYHTFVPAWERPDGDVNLSYDKAIYGFDPPEGYEFLGVVHRLGSDEAQKWVDTHKEEYDRLMRGEKSSHYIH
jgi:hypothetical protein